MKREKNLPAPKDLCFSKPPRKQDRKYNNYSKQWEKKQ